VIRRTTLIDSIGRPDWALGTRTDCALCKGSGRVPLGRESITVTCGRCLGAGWHYEREVTR
jgi:hypothetical protein